MEGRRYFTRVKNSHPVYGGKEYVVGVVMGIMSATTNDETIGPLWFEEETGDHILQVATTDARYQLFVARVSKKYPDLCEFNIDIGER